MGLFSSFRSAAERQAPEIVRPRLELSGEALAEALRSLVESAEEHGGIERYVEAVRLRSALFRDVLGGGAEMLEPDRFAALCAFMPTVRRRIAPYLDPGGFALMRNALAELLTGMSDVVGCDARIASFTGRFPQDKGHRFVRDLAAEVLHNLDPERYPLMTRWVWDAKANTGVLREIWFGDDVDHLTLTVDDSYATFVALREELAQYLTANGVFRDMPQYIDALCAQVYAQYICSQGGAYLRTDFSAAEDPMLHSRRMLGLDGFERLQAVAGRGSRAAGPPKRIG